MNFDGVKVITIPEGSVKKIMRGVDVLWSADTVKELVCNPTIELIHNGATYNGSATSGAYFNVKVVISGISNELINSLDIIYTYRQENYTKNISVGDANTEFEQVFYDSFGFGYAYTVQCVLSLNYTTPEGYERTLTTSSLRDTNAKGTSVTASV